MKDKDKQTVLVVSILVVLATFMLIGLFQLVLGVAIGFAFRDFIKKGIVEVKKTLKVA